MASILQMAGNLGGNLQAPFNSVQSPLSTINWGSQIPSLSGNTQPAKDKTKSSFQPTMGMGNGPLNSANQVLQPNLKSNQAITPSVLGQIPMPYQNQSPPIGSNAYSIASQYIGKTANNDHQYLSDFFQKQLKQNVDPRNTPWCAAFVGSVENAAGRPGTGSLAARSYLNYGTGVTDPQKGDIVVFKSLTNPNDSAHGHVAYFDSFDPNGNPVVLGGNQGGQVKLRAYPSSYVLDYRRPDSNNNNTQTVNANTNSNIQNTSAPESEYNSAMGEKSEALQPVEKDVDDFGQPTY